MRLVQGQCSTLILVLILGNWLNKNNPKYGKAHGFKVDVLKKLETMRIKSKQISVMNLLLRLTQKQFKMDPNMQNEIKIISTAASIDINHIDEEVKNIATCINKAESTVSSIKQLEQIESNEVFLRKMNDFLVESSEKMMKLKQENCRLKDSFADLRKYFGDDNKDTTSEEFFSTFKCFLTKFKG
ncbi:hypothetical protein GJ496_010551 [Pomphorhynchus laevis]|nr:hypothetical protein GJ496_010551 [Pomphorhynchus laevis]